MSRTNYIFIDYENVQDTDLDRIDGKPVKVVLVLGERQFQVFPSPLPLLPQRLLFSRPAPVRDGRARGWFRELVHLVRP